MAARPGWSISKRKLASEGVLRELKMRRHYMKPSVKRRKKQAEAARRRRKRAKMDAALSALSGLQVQSYVDAATKTGADKPAMTIAVTFADGKKEDRLVFSRVGAEVFATRSGEPGAARVEAAKFDEALAAIDALK